MHALIHAHEHIYIRQSQRTHVCIRTHIHTPTPLVYGFVRTAFSGAFNEHICPAKVQMCPANSYRTSYAGHMVHLALQNQLTNTNMNTTTTTRTRTRTSTRTRTRTQPRLHEHEHEHNHNYTNTNTNTNTNTRTQQTRILDIEQDNFIKLYSPKYAKYVIKASKLKIYLKYNNTYIITYSRHVFFDFKYLLIMT